MPKEFDKEIKKASRKRGKPKIRTIEIPGHPGMYAHIYVFPKAGPRGGKTIMSPVKHKKGK